MGFQMKIGEDGLQVVIKSPCEGLIKQYCWSFGLANHVQPHTDVEGDGTSFSCVVLCVASYACVVNHATYMVAQGLGS